MEGSAESSRRELDAEDYEQSIRELLHIITNLMTEEQLDSKPECWVMTVRDYLERFH